MFGLIIDYLRNGQKVLKQEIQGHEEAFENELEFWGLKPAESDIIKELKQILQTKPSRQGLSEKVIEIWDQLGQLNIPKLDEVNEDLQIVHKREIQDTIGLYTYIFRSSKPRGKPTRSRRKTLS